MGPKANSQQANGKAHPKAPRAHTRAWPRAGSWYKAQLPASAVVQLPSCAPLNLNNYPWEERGSPAAEQLAIGKMDYITLLSPCLAHSLCIFKLFSPTRASPVPGTRGAPGSAIEFVREYKYPGEENGNRSTGTEPSL